MTRPFWTQYFAVIAGCYSLLFRGRNDQESRISAAKSGLWLFFGEFISEISEAYGPLGRHMPQKVRHQL
jgi:hypothetical protein